MNLKDIDRSIRSMGPHTAIRWLRGNYKPLGYDDPDDMQFYRRKKIRAGHYIFMGYEIKREKRRWHMKPSVFRTKDVTFRAMSLQPVKLGSQVSLEECEYHIFRAWELVLEKVLEIYEERNKE